MTRNLTLSIAVLVVSILFLVISTPPQPVHGQGPTTYTLFFPLAYSCYSVGIQPTVIDPALTQPPFTAGYVEPATVPSGQPYYHLLRLSLDYLGPWVGGIRTYTETIYIANDACHPPTSVQLQKTNLWTGAVAYDDIGVDPQFQYVSYYHGWVNYEFVEAGQVIPRDRPTGYRYVSHDVTLRVLYERVTAP